MRKKQIIIIRVPASFLQYLEDLFANYNVEEGRIVHVGQKASCALVAAIQLITFPGGELAENKLEEIKQYGNIIAMYGSKEQKKMFFNAVSEYQRCLISVLPPTMFAGNNEMLVSG